MITEPQTAKQINDLMLDMFNRLVESCNIVEAHCSGAEYAAYKKATARLASNIVFDVLEPLYEKNPTLKPENWEDPPITPFRPSTL